jgi:hypothetical protein
LATPLTKLHAPLSLSLSLPSFFSRYGREASVQYLTGGTDDDAEDDEGFDEVDTPSPSSSKSSGELSAGAIVGLSVVATLVVVFGVILTMKLKTRKEAEHQNLIMR